MQFDNQTTRNVADIVARILAGESVKQEPKMLEEELVGNQHKIDANKNNKIDAHDFKLLRKKKKVEEEAEQIDELKKSTLGSYVKKASKDLANSSFEHGEDEHRQYGDPEDTERENEMKKRERDIENRQKGISRAATKLSKEETELAESHFKVGDKVKCKESGMDGEITKIDKEDGGEDEKYYTFKREDGKVMKKAPNELSKINEEVDKKKKDLPFTPDATKKPVRNSDGTIQKPMSLARELAKRGLKKAMSKEEVEQIDELSKDSYKKYLSTSKKLVGDHAKGSQLSRYGEYGAKDRELNTKNAQKHAMKKLKEEEIDEAMFPGTKEYEKKYGQSPQQKLKKKGDTVPTSQGDMTKTDKGIAHRRRFTEMLESYTEGGLKYIASLVQEEPDNEEYTKEVEDQKAKMDGKKKGGDVAKASVQAVKNEEVEELDELSKSTLASYAKKASHEARMKHGIGKDFERISKSSRKPEYKQGAKEWEDKYKSDARRREAGVGKAIDRLAKEEVELDEAINHLQMAKHHQAIAKEHDRISHKAAGNDEDDLSIAHSDQSEVHQDAAKAHLQAHKTGNPKDVASAKKATKQSLQNDTTRIMRSNYTHFYNVTKGRKSSTGEDDHKDYNYSELRSGADAIKKGLNEETEIQVINADIANGVEQIDIEERSLSEPEMKKKEEIVMSMKKKMPGFKERYGDRAKEVMYATATKMAKKD
jgi:hypothetical protein